ncbi:MAG: hypothetical protein Q3977_05685 [Oscillospiraceae bacterium]|nr:hypothetical protein [Oscillospiraceae bacterium]
MNEQILIFHYPESDWDNDLVGFRLPEDCEPMRLLEELNDQQDALSATDYASLQDYADAVCTVAAQVLGATWRYIPQCGTLEFRYE